MAKKGQNYEIKLNIWVNEVKKKWNKRSDSKRKEDTWQSSQKFDKQRSKFEIMKLTIVTIDQNHEKS